MSIPFVAMLGPAVLTAYRKDFRLEERKIVRIARRDVREFCDQVLELGGQLVHQGRTDDAATLYRIGCESMTLSFGTVLDEGYLAEEALRQAESEESAGEKVRILRRCIRRIQKVTGFRPIMEAAMPTEFPEPSAPRVVRTKTYPAFRIAKTQVGAGRMRECFHRIHKHFKKNHIPMTVPVIMELDVTSAGKGRSEVRETSVGFPYRRMADGPELEAEEVEVFDCEPVTVVSVGGRGGYNSKHYGRAIRRLEAWLAFHGERFERAGRMRVLAYNNPFIPSFMKYYEVQIPVRQIEQSQ